VELETPENNIKEISAYYSLYLLDKQSAFIKNISTNNLAIGTERVN